MSISDKKLEEAMRFSDKVKACGLFDSVGIKQIADRTGCSRKYVKRMLDIFKKTGTVRFECSLNLSKIPIYPIFIGIR
ncbi:MAG: hypothetical protein ABIA21_03315, partial [Candidatus Aenigmatarchaeota archaeon]